MPSSDLSYGSLSTEEECATHVNLMVVSTRHDWAKGRGGNPFRDADLNTDEVSTAVVVLGAGFSKSATLRLARPARAGRAGRAWKAFCHEDELRAAVVRC